MTRATLRLRAAAVVIWVLGSGPTLLAQMGVGTWVQQSVGASPGALTMTVEACCNGGRRLVYRAINSPDVMMTVESPFDGTDAPIMAGGKPTGGTMGIKRVDDRHTVASLKMKGTIYGTSRATLSPDGKTMTVESEITSASSGQPVGKQTEVWVRK